LSNMFVFNIEYATVYQKHKTMLIE